MKRRPSEQKHTLNHAHAKKRRAKFYGKVLASRDRAFRREGFKSYNAYIHSDFWHELRAMVFATKGRECVRCGERAEQVHHSSYDRETILGMSLDCLWPCCCKCHQFAEESPRKASEPDGKLKRANQRLGVAS